MVTHQYRNGMVYKYLRLEMTPIKIYQYLVDTLGEFVISYDLDRR